MGGNGCPAGIAACTEGSGHSYAGLSSLCWNFVTRAAASGCRVMRLQALRHLAETVQSLTRWESDCILGSASFLPVYPELGNPGGSLKLCYDGDRLISPSDEKTAAMVHEAIGEGSFFAGQNGYLSDLLRPENKETMPRGWETRLKQMDAGFLLSSLHTLDLAVVKLQTGRDKAQVLLGQRLDLNLLSWEEIKRYLDRTPMTEEKILLSNQRLSNLKGRDFYE